ncbi:WD repeat and FYVE domain-containing protein 1, partial [Eschrichtius robustus]|nr:WD repeat and FYVE domain-containing protein 1 [Eschrichtius robustus]
MERGGGALRCGGFNSDRGEELETLNVEFHVSEDFNKMNFIKTYPAHQNRVTAIIFSLATEWVISTGHDKYDFDTQYAFVGDCSGQITLLKLEQSSCSVITTLKGHEGSVACLWWDPIQRLLFSGASDNSIIMWDIGGRKGRALLLQGHQCVTVCEGGERI